MGTELSPLSNVEASDLARCEKTIEKGIGTFQATGHALIEVRDKKLFRRDYATFPEYLAQRWPLISGGRARQLIASVKNTESVTNVTIPNEAVARELGKVPKDRQQAVADWATEKADGKPLTAAAIKQATVEVLEAEPEDEPEDSPIDADAYDGDTDVPPPVEHVNRPPNPVADNSTSALTELLAFLRTLAKRHGLSDIGVISLLDNAIAAKRGDT
ncbi:hypothetical protein M0R72_12605 [Candidatus Pacearchaeota archaeon]|jgi:hypothetical protein|nr:hypothetical protein [Candidatus Pacearchaeota archaeon]